MRQMAVTFLTESYSSSFGLIAIGIPVILFAIVLLKRVLAATSSYIEATK
jgi:hypothetical protein